MIAAAQTRWISDSDASRQDLIYRYWTDVNRVRSVAEKRQRQNVSENDHDEALSMIGFPRYKPIAPEANVSMWALAEWDGFVTELQTSLFVAMMSLVGSDGEITERLEYPLQGLRESDRGRLTVGTFFRFSVGYSTRKSGKREQSASVFLRLKNVSAHWIPRSSERDQSAFQSHRD